MLPAALRSWINPDGMREMGRQPLDPELSRFLVPMLDRSPRLRDLVRAHAGVADQDQHPVGPVAAQDVPGRRFSQMPPAAAAPQALIGTVVEMECLEILELGTGGREKL